jgi:hypothetical protein
MLDDLRAWEKATPKSAIRLLVVSTGSVEENRAQSLRAPSLLDQNFSTGQAFGTTGTPSAILVDREGKVASRLAVGAVSVMDLAAALETARS